MNATTAALEVVEASLDEQLNDWQPEQLNDWQPEPGRRHWLANQRAGVRMRADGSEMELSGIVVSVPWSWRRRLRTAIERWAARKAVSRFKGTKFIANR